jgi:ArsR family transcriptional regulator
MKLEETAAGLEALGSPTRLTIYRLLVRAGLEGLAVGTIQAKTEVPRSTLSHHLHRLISVGLVAQERHGTTLICRANYRTMEQIVDFLTDECCVDAAKGDEDAA